MCAATIVVNVTGMEQNYPYYYDDNVGVMDVTLQFRHVGVGDSINSINAFLDQIANSMNNNEGKIRITITEVPSNDTRPAN